MVTVVDRLVEHARRLQDIRQEIADVEGKLALLKASKSELEGTTIPQMMEDAEIDKMSIQGVGTLYLEQKVHVSILKADSEKFFAFLTERGEDSIITRSVHHKTLSAWGKEMLAKQLPLPEYLKVYPQQVARIRKK